MTRRKVGLPLHEGDPDCTHPMMPIRALRPIPQLRFDESRVKTYDEWEREVPAALRVDPVWHTRVYRLAAFLTDAVVEDCGRFTETSTARAICEQLIAAAASIGANVAEGYSRSGRADRARFFEYALGSARECRHWVYSIRHEFEPNAAMQHLQTLDEIVRLLVTMVVRERGRRRVGSRR